MKYSSAVEVAFDAIEKATWLSKDDYAAVVRLFHEYEAEKSDNLGRMIELIGQPDADVTSSWNSFLLLAKAPLNSIRDKVPYLRDGDPSLGLGDWTDRETRGFEGLKAEAFLAARHDLIELTKVTVEATELLNQQWMKYTGDLAQANNELDQKSDAWKEKFTLWAERIGGASDLLGTALGNYAIIGEALSGLSLLKDFARPSKDGLDQLGLGLKARRESWETLNKLNEFQAEVLKQVDPDVINRISERAKLENVSDTEDYKAFATDARDRLASTHLQSALAASVKYREAANEKFAERSESTLQSITQLDKLGKRLSEWQEFQAKAQSYLNALSEEKDRDERRTATRPSGKSDRRSDGSARQSN